MNVILTKLIEVLTTVKNSGVGTVTDKKTELLIIGLLVYEVFFK